MIIREAGVTAGISWAVGLWSLGFAINTALTADLLTSPQWQSLMTVPGGKWFWTTIFGGSGITLIAGLVDTRYLVRGIGLGLIGAGCLGIGGWYMIAPFFHLGPLTLGYWPWFLGVGIGMLGAIANWWPIEWF